MCTLRTKRPTSKRGVSNLYYAGNFVVPSMCLLMCPPSKELFCGFAQLVILDFFVYKTGTLITRNPSETSVSNARPHLSEFTASNSIADYLNPRATHA